MFLYLKNLFVKLFQCFLKNDKVTIITNEIKDGTLSIHELNDFNSVNNTINEITTVVTEDTKTVITTILSTVDDEIGSGLESLESLEIGKDSIRTNINTSILNEILKK